MADTITYSFVAIIRVKLLALGRIVRGYKMLRASSDAPMRAYVGPSRGDHRAAAKVIFDLMRRQPAYPGKVEASKLLWRFWKTLIARPPTPVQSRSDDRTHAPQLWRLRNLRLVPKRLPHHSSVVTFAGVTGSLFGSGFSPSLIPLAATLSKPASFSAPFSAVSPSA
jgi:hypothetical protein